MLTHHENQYLIQLDLIVRQIELAIEAGERHRLPDLYMRLADISCSLAALHLPATAYVN